MRTSRFGRGLLLGFALSFSVTAVAGLAWLLLRPEPPCAELDAASCLALIAAEEALASLVRPAVAVLGLCGPLLGLAWRDARRRALAEQAR